MYSTKVYNIKGTRVILGEIAAYEHCDGQHRNGIRVTLKSGTQLDVFPDATSTAAHQIVENVIIDLDNLFGSYTP